MAAGNEYGYKGTYSFYQSDFSQGEAGDKLAVNIDSPIYSITANTIVNAIPTDTGSLRIIKKTVAKKIEDNLDIQQIINTRYNYYVAIGRNKICTVRKSDDTVINYVAYDSGYKYDRKFPLASIIDRFLIIPLSNDDGTTFKRLDYELASDGRIAYNQNFATAIRNPIKNRYKGKVDIYQVRKYTISVSSDGTKKEELRAFKVSTTDFQEFKVVSNKLKFRYNDDLNLTRIYIPYRTDLINVSPIPNASENEYFISLYDPQTSEGYNWYLGNVQAEFTGKTNDTSGTWYNGITLKTGNIGLSQFFNYGSMINLNNQTGFYMAIEYQNRMVVSDGYYIYFSKVADYNWFVNDSESSDSFFIKLSNVLGEEPKILKMISGRGIWVITDKGVFLLGYNQVVSGASIDVRLITADKCTGEAVVIRNTLYYLTTDGELKAIQNTTSARGYIDFEPFTVDKFFKTDKISKLSEIVIENKNFLLASLSEYEEINGMNVGARLYYENKLNVFSRVSVEFPINSMGYNEDLITFDEVKKFQKTNVQYAYIRLNQVPVKTKKYGYLRNDSTTQVSQFTARFTETDGRAIKNIIMAGVNTNIIGSYFQEYYSVFSSAFSKALKDKIDLKIETLQNENDCELQATEIQYKPCEE